jgi:hypothetical protein
MAAVSLGGELVSLAGVDRQERSVHLPIPERLVTIRTYDSAELAAEDHQALLDEGFDAYLSGSAFRPAGYSELRVPESQAEEALDVLPPEVPTLQQLARPNRTCRVCGGTLVQEAPALARYVLFGGMAVAAWSLLRGDARAAFVLVITTVAVAAFLRNVTGRQVCEQCGTTWQPHVPDEDE